MAIENKRVIDLATESTSLAGDEYVLLDSNNTGTTKYRLSRLSDQIEDVDEAVQTEATARANAVTAEATARTNADTTLQGNITAEASARQTADTALEGEITDLKDDLDHLREKTYNLLDCNSAKGWYPSTVGKDVTVSIPKNDTIRVTSNISQAYAGVRKNIDVTGINTLYTSFASNTGTGAYRARLYGVSGSSATSLGTITTARKTWDVSSYDTVAIELLASVATALEGYIDYEKILVTSDSTGIAYVPYYMYEPYAHEIESDFNDFKTQEVNPSWTIYSHYGVNDRCKNYPIFVQSGSIFHFDPGEIDFRCSYDLYSTYAFAKASYDSATYIDGDIFKSGTIRSTTQDIEISQDSWIMIIGYLGTSGELQTDTIPSGNIIRRSVFSEIEELKQSINTDTDTINSIIGNNIEAGYNLINAKMRSTRVDRDVTDKPSLLSLLHFTDLHGDTTNLKRIVEFRTAYPNFIDDAICTGDMITSHYNSSAMNFWNSVEGTENIMMTIGNHDVWKENATEFSPGNYITQAEAYDVYIAPYVSNWDVTYSQNHTYYYKDYSDAKIRLICLDMMLEGTDRTAQLTWLQCVLSDAITAGLSVVIAQHFATRPNTVFPCNFSALDGYASTTEGWSPESTYMDAVETFKTGGGDFICWLGGHTHCDYICYDPSYPTQLFITVTCARNSQSYSDQARISNTKSQDAFNIVAFDAYSKLIKLIRVGANSDSYQRGRNTLTINYATKAIVAHS